MILCAQPELIKLQTVTTSPIWSVSSTRTSQHFREWVAVSFAFTAFKFSTVLASRFRRLFAEGGLLTHLRFLINFSAFSF